MFNIDYITKEDIEEHIPNWPQISDHQCNRKHRHKIFK